MPLDGIDPATVDRLVLSLIVFTALAVLRAVFGWIVDRRTANVRLRYRAKKLATYPATTLGILLVGPVWFSGFGSVSTFLGLLTAGVQKALQNYLSGYPVEPSFPFFSSQFSRSQQLLGGYGG